MQAALGALRAEYAFELDVVDVDTAQSLEQRYGEWVPVLAHGERVLCHYFLDHSAVTAYLAAFR
jgi:thioredoxin reductase (NADPH)